MPQVASNVADEMQSLSPERRKSLQYAVVEGSLANVMGTLVGGAFLTGFALLLGAADLHIGLLAAIPALANLTQVFGGRLIRRFGSRKRLCLLSISASRSLWVAILMIPFLFLGEGWSDWRVWLLLAGIALISIFSSAAAVAWLSWITDLVPNTMRGRYNGRRNMYAGIAAMAAGLAGGKLIDVFGGRDVPEGFAVLFGIGVAFGLFALLVMARMDEPPLEKPGQSKPFFSELREPLADAAFRAYIFYKVAWAFAVGLAGPFFSVYMIRTLELPFSLIATFGVVSSVTTIVGMRIWGGVHDRIGPKPLLLICSIFQAAVPLWWLLASPENIGPVWIVHIIGGVMSAGIGLASSGLLVQLAPPASNTTYFGVHAAFVGLSGAVAPLIGGVVGVIVATSEFTIGPMHLQGLHILFLLSAVLRFVSLGLLGKVDAGRPLEPGELLPGLAKLQEMNPMFGLNQAVGVGLAAAENVNTSLARGSLAMEQRIEHQIARSIERLKQAKGSAERLDQRVSEGLDVHEQRLNVLFDRIEQVVRRIASWLGRR